TYSSMDPPSSTLNGTVHNFVGIIGAYISYFFLFLFGNIALMIPLVLIYYAILLILNKLEYNFRKTISFIALIFSSSIILQFNEVFLHPNFRWGGVIINFIAEKMQLLFGNIGSYIILILVSIICIISIFNILFKNIFLKILGFISGIFSGLIDLSKNLLKKVFSFKKRRKEKSTKRNKKSKKKKNQEVGKQIEYFQAEKRKKDSIKSENIQKQNPEIINNDSQNFEYNGYKSLTPPLEILNYLKKANVRENVDELKYKLEDALDEFGIEGKVVNVEVGPMASLYEVDVKKGTKVRKITSLDKDLSLMLSKSNIRIIAPLPHKGTVGFEIPNKHRQFVSLRELIESDKYQESGANLAVAFGKTMNGDSLIMDISQMPHLLISGATNSGKSIGIHAIITSLLYKYTYKQVKFLMIDPKRLEFPHYNGLPHLLSDVIVEPKEANNILKWALYEMEKRYEKLSKHGYRNIQTYHEKEDNTEDMPYILIVVDEMADLIMNSGQDLEHSIIRLAQMSRAVGIHLILATQRPSVDIITGTIKANFPSRVAYKTATKNNSRIILDDSGAENLLGKGDFLYRSIDGELIRGQGALVTVDEIRETVDYLKNIKVEEDNFQEVFEREKEITVEMDDKDELYSEVLRIVYNNLVNGKDYVSISYLQRKLSIGYNRAARIVDTLAEDGIVDTQNISNKGRPILVEEKTLEEYID
ncbi:MAG: DNA translocase FtsK, partial [Candidatus Mcinerneyibacterium aminivorans]